MRLTTLVLAIVGCAGCVQQPAVNVRAVGQGYTCTVTVNGAAVSTDAELLALAQANKRALLETDRNTPYRCIGGTIVRLQQAGFKVLEVTADGKPIMRR